MLFMGLTLTPADFVDVARRPSLVALGCALHYTVMPLAAIVIAKLLDLDAQYTVGMVLVGTTSSGTASNVINYLAGGHVALAVSLTIVSTLLAVVLMPALTYLLVGQMVPVPAVQMIVAVLQVAIVPVALGMIGRRYFASAVARIQQWLPAASVVTICLIISIIVALNSHNIARAGAVIVLAVVLHNLTGFIAGYGLARLCRADVTNARTIAIEVGMQNSGLSVALALKFFALQAALPGAVFSVWHNVSGSLLAAWWAKREKRLTVES
jgi:BASS family bile acid:Na+ symporter